MKNNKTKYQFKIFRYSAIIAGLVFLSNPLVGLVDILPDFIGYFFLIVGLDGVGRLNGDIEYGIKKLKYLCIISVVSIVLMFYTFKMDSSWNLTLTFSYMAVSVIFGLGATKSIFTGLDYLTDRHGSEGFPEIFEPSLMTKLYIIVKSALVVIPQLYALVEVNAAGELSPETDYMAILATKKYAVAVCILFSIAMALAWLKYIIKYCRAFKKDDKLISELTSMYMSDFSKNGIPMNFFEINFGSGLILVSHVFIYDFVLDTVHFLPEFLSILISILGLLILKRYLNLKGIWKYAICAFVAQVVLYFYRAKFIENIILDIEDINLQHIIISFILALIYIVSTWKYFLKIHAVTVEAYEEMFNRKNTEMYEWGDIFYLIALISGGANLICPIWRPYFIAVMFVSLFAAMYHFTKIYTKFEKNI